MLGRIDNEMQIQTHYADTHPCLKDRLEALGAAMQIPPIPQTSAAEAWLGDKNQQIMQDFDREWLNANGESWKQRYEYVTNAKTRLQEYANVSLSELDDENLWNYAYWTNEFESASDALPLFRAFQERHPDDTETAYFIGMHLIAQGDAAGLEQLRLARKSADLIQQAAEAGYDFLRQRNQTESAEAWWQESLEQNQVFIAAHQERENLSKADNLIYPEIGYELLTQLVSELKAQKKVGKAWLAQKTVQHFPESPVYVIAFAPKGFSLSSSSVQSEVANSLNLRGDFFVVCKSGETKGLAKKVIKVGKRLV